MIEIQRGHIVKSYDQELARLKYVVLELGVKCMGQVTRLLNGPTQADTAKIQGILADEAEVDRLQHEADELTVRLLAMRQPVAIDLRTIISALKMALDFERIADYTVNIALYSTDLAACTYGAVVEKIQQMALHAQEMLGQVLEAYRTLDAEKAAEVWHYDARLDAVYAGFMALLPTLVLDQGQTLKDATSLLFIARSWERIGDHIKNIAENIHFIVTGQTYTGGPKG